ncbi:MAG: leucine-rich repeat domain-containing protein [Lachnospiraceae bacterium]|nr:leucine-rich repeat domain-containing protein [Lachnospiraceae bacterium]
MNRKVRHIIKSTLLGMVSMFMAFSLVVTDTKAATMASGQCGENVYWELDAEGNLHIYGSGDMYVDLIDEFNDYRDIIKTIVIDEGVTSVACNMFNFCENITTVSLPGTLKSIGGYAFNRCSSLKNINFPESLESIGGFAFEGCALESVIVPEGITAIEDSVFRSCVVLKDIKLPSTLESIGTKAFWGCESLEGIQFNEGLKVIGEDAFGAAFTTDTELVLPSTLEKIERGAFCMSHVKSINIAGVLTEIPADAFYICSDLEEVVLSNSIQYIGVNAFNACIKLKTIVIPDQVYCIDLDAFSNCTSLENIMIPASVHSFGAHVFKNCENVTIMGYEGSKAQTFANENGILFYKLEGEGKILTPCVVETGKIGENVTWTFENTGKLTISGTGPMFDDCRDLSVDNIYFNDINLYSKYKNAVKEVIIEEGVTRIGGSAFKDCINLEKVTISDTVTEIYDWAFSTCVSLKEVKLPDTVEYIAGYAFHYCGELEKLEILRSEVKIDADAFLYSDALTIYGYAGGSLEQYAKDNNIPFVISAAKIVPYYNITVNGGTFEKDANGVYYYELDGVRITDAFFCDGIYTYYLQYDGSPMMDRLTYHPDGEHIIYFDENGHEVFSDFANIKVTIAGEKVDDYCFFDVNGYLYVDVVTYDKEGKNLYYANPYGVLERDNWFQFSDTVMCADGTPWEGAAGGFGYANADGTLMVNTYTYDWEGRLCYMQGNGVALY